MKGFRITRACFAGLACLCLASCQEDLYTKLSESEANQIVAILTQKGISASRVFAKDGTVTVRVEESSFAAAVDILNAAGIPKTKFVTMGEVFPDNKLISSPTEERARYVFALSQELSKTLSEIDGVIAARVHIVLPKNDPLRQEDKPSSASVFIKYEPETSVKALLPQIKSLVANSVEGLAYEKVSVVFVPAEKSKMQEALTVSGDASGAKAPNVNSRYNASAPFALLLAALGAGVLALVLWRRPRSSGAKSTPIPGANGGMQDGAAG